MPRRYTEDRFTLADLRCAADRYCNWGKWGPNDEYGTLNYITPEDVINAGKLIKKGRTFALGLNFDRFGPQKNSWGNRFNPIHLMLATGTDAVSGRQDSMKIRYADDMISMPLQCGTQWDALGHIFYDEQMWNGYDARLVDSDGAQRCGIERSRTRWSAAACCSMLPAISNWITSRTVRPLPSKIWKPPRAVKKLKFAGVTL